MAWGTSDLGGPRWALQTHRQLLVVQGRGMHLQDFERGTVSATFASLTVAAGDAAGWALSVSHETILFCLSCRFAEVCTEAGSLQWACEGCGEQIQAKVKSTLQQKPAPNLISESRCGREGRSNACVINDKVWANTCLLAKVPHRSFSAVPQFQPLSFRTLLHYPLSQTAVSMTCDLDHPTPPICASHPARGLIPRCTSGLPYSLGPQLICQVILWWANPRQLMNHIPVYGTLETKERWVASTVFSPYRKKKFQPGHMKMPWSRVLALMQHAKVIWRCLFYFLLALFPTQFFYCYPSEQVSGDGDWAGNKLRQLPILSKHQTSNHTQH